jgi:hypothetical protein
LVSGAQENYRKPCQYVFPVKLTCRGRSQWFPLRARPAILARLYFLLPGCVSLGLSIRSRCERTFQR